MVAEPDADILERILEAAIRAGVTHDEFWGLSLREIERVTRINQEGEKERENMRWWHTAHLSANIVNAIGWANSTEWVMVGPEIYHPLIERPEPEAPKERFARLRAGHEARLERERLKREQRELDGERN